MIPQEKINDYENEINGILKKIDDCKKSSMTSTQKNNFIGQNARILTEKVNNLITNTPLGSLDIDLIVDLMEHKTGLPKNWNIYKMLVRYTNIKDIEKKKTTLKDIENEIIELNKKVLQRDIVLSLAKSVYTSNNRDLIDLFYKNIPIPPLSMFDEDQQPPILVSHEFETKRAVSKFEEQNVQGKQVNSKIHYLQRHLRGSVRKDSEVERLSFRYYKDDPNGEIKAKEMIQEANKPYFPKGCSPELSRRIVIGALDIKLYDSVSHLLAANKTNIILDGFLYGRSNLLSSYMDFRPAALIKSDVDNGDGNVICMGPDKIDPRCLVGRTIGLELDLEALTNERNFNKNPSMFFKQTDLGFSIGHQNIKIKDNSLSFTHNGYLQGADQNSANLLIGPSEKEVNYYSEIPKDLLISYNVKEMDKILILNFFRYLDNLRDVKDGKLASKKIKEIYDQIDSLDNEEFTLFLKDLGKKMSCTAEFNFYGAYKIDLNALKSITIYQGETVINKVKIDDLCDQLNSANFELLKVLKAGNPEILKSSNFVEFLLSKVDSQEAKQAITEFI